MAQDETLKMTENAVHLPPRPTVVVGVKPSGEARLRRYSAHAAANDDQAGTNRRM